MSVIEVTLGIWDFSRGRTLALLDQIAATADPVAVLGWRPGTGRAHIAWQFMHIGVTEELFATERLVGTPPNLADLVSRFRGGSTPDDAIPDVAQIREVLESTRARLRETLGRFSDADLSTVPDALRERGWTVGTALQVLTWHEAHHQGQAHLTWNLWQARSR